MLGHRLKRSKQMDIWQVLVFGLMAVWAIIFLFWGNRFIRDTYFRKTVSPDDVPTRIWKKLVKDLPLQKSYYRLSYGNIVGDRLDLGGELATIQLVAASLFGVMSFAPPDFDRWWGESWGG